MSETPTTQTEADRLPINEDRPQVGDPCRTCGRPRTELGAGAISAYCWWCQERTADGSLVQAHQFDPDEEAVTEGWTGAPLYASWGYNQTNVDFARIIDVSGSGKTVVCRLVGADVVERGPRDDQVAPTYEVYGDEFRLHARGGRDQKPVFRGNYPHVDGDTEKGTRMGTFLPYAGRSTVSRTPATLGH